MESTKLILEVVIMAIALVSTGWNLFHSHNSTVRKRYAAEQDFKTLAKGQRELKEKISEVEKTQEDNQKIIQVQLDQIRRLLLIKFSKDGDTDSISGLFDQPRNEHRL